MHDVKTVEETINNEKGFGVFDRAQTKSYKPRFVLCFKTISVLPKVRGYSYNTDEQHR